MAQQNTFQRPTIEQIKEKWEFELMKVPGVTGIGIGENPRKPGRVIKVYVDRMTSELKRQIPRELEGYPVSIEQTGEFRAF